jgi:hypothetical protein
VVHDAALMSDAARLVTEERPPAVSSFGRNGDDDDNSVRLPTLAFVPDSERTAQAHLYRAAAEAPRLRLCIAYAVVRRLRMLASANVARINFERHAFAGSLSERTLRVRGLLGARVVNTIVSRLQAAAGVDTSSGVRPTISVDRIGACTRANTVPTCFEQMSMTMMRRPVTELRCASGARAFRVEMIGEGVSDAGGGYREILDVMCREAQTQPPKEPGAALLDDTPRNPGGATPLLLPCPNAQLAAEAIGVGQYRDKFVLNPSAKSSEHLKLYRFLGWLMGIAFMSESPLPLDLAAAGVEGAGRRRGDGEGSARHRPVLRPVARRHAPGGGERRDARQLWRHLLRAVHDDAERRLRGRAGRRRREADGDV